MARFSLVIDLPGLNEDQTLLLNSFSDDQKRTLTRFMIANGKALLEAKPEDFGRMVEVCNYAMLQAFLPSAANTRHPSPSAPDIGIEEVQAVRCDTPK